MRYLGLCAIARDETPYLEEWVQFHAALGVEHFVLYDNESEIPIARTLEPYLAGGLVTIVPIAGLCPQRQAYEDCLERFGPDHRWLGFLDIDEFALPAAGRDLRSLLAEYESFAGLAANWVTYGSAGHMSPPAGLVTENYLLRCPEPDSHVKCFVHPAKVTASDSPHRFIPEPGSTVVNEDFLTVHGNHAPHAQSRIRINHYFFRSQQDFQKKIDRWHHNHHGHDQDSLQSIFQDQLERCTVPDPAALETARKIKALTAKGGPEAFCRLSPAAETDHLFRFMEQAGARVEAGQYEDAQVVLAQAGMYHAGQEELALMRAGVAILQGRTQWAKQLINDVLAKDFMPEAYLMLADLAFLEGKAEKLRDLVAYLEVLAAMHREQGVELPEGFAERLNMLRAKALS